MRSGTWQLTIATALVLLLVAVGTLQYRWLGEVSTAEAARLRASLQTRASAFTLDVDRDITRAFASFQIEPSVFDANPAQALAEATARAARDSASGNAIRCVLVAEPGSSERPMILDVAHSRLERAEWPPELAGTRARLNTAPTFGPAGVPLPPGFAGDAVDPTAPALIVPLTDVSTGAGDHPIGDGQNPPRQWRWRAIVVWLDEARLRDRLVAPAIQREFGAADDFNISIVRTSDAAPVFRAGAADVQFERADLTLPLFALKIDELRWDHMLPAPSSGAPSKDRVAITIVRRTSSGDMLYRAGSADGAGAWRLMIQARPGSLDAVVARSRRRNMAIGLGTMALLGGSVLLTLVVSGRERRLARQQIEFVASVSHELRTPLAVIRSAGENLADGVVGGAQVAQYGELIQSEGRRLSEMVERVMDFADMTGRTILRSRQTIALTDLVRDAVAALSHEAAQRQVRVDMTGGVDASVSGDADALGSALRNVIGNAIKYSPGGAVVEVEITLAADRVQIGVRDSGIGIDEEDLAHVFDPFFRGRRAVDSQARGSGLGLSVARRMVNAHQGRISVTRRPGGGTEAIIDLAAVARDRASTL